MSAVYLPIRSFGDFVITASVIKAHATGPVPVILPHYLRDIFTSIGSHEYFDVLKHINFDNQPAFFEIYKVTDTRNATRLLRDMKAIFKVLTADYEYLLDYSSKRLLYTGARLRWPAVNQNIYKAKYDLFARYFRLKPYHNDMGILPFEKNNARVLVLPDSRIKDKEINPELVSEILSRFGAGRVAVAKFSAAPHAGGSILSYGSFTQLLNLINSYQLIISAESLPYHLANYCGKPHFVIYNKSRHFKDSFMTPYMQSHGFYAFAEQNGHTDVINKLETILL